MRGVDGKTCVSRGKLVAFGGSVTMRRARMGAQCSDAIADAVEALQDALEVIVSHILGRETKQVRDLGPKRPQHLLARQRLALGFEVAFADALKDRAGGGDGGTGIGLDGLVGALVFDLNCRYAVRPDPVGERARWSRQGGAMDIAGAAI
jgi:hypothetical protein